MAATQVLRPTGGREASDCAVAALAMYLGVSYEDVLRATVEVDRRHQGRVGLMVSQIKRIAAAFGTGLKLKKTVDDDDYGILILTDHALVVRNGLAFDPTADGSVAVWDLDDYLKAASLRRTTISGRRVRVGVEGVLVETEGS